MNRSFNIAMIGATRTRGCGDPGDLPQDWVIRRTLPLSQVAGFMLDVVVPPVTLPVLWATQDYEWSPRFGRVRVHRSDVLRVDQGKDRTQEDTKDIDS